MISKGRWTLTLAKFSCDGQLGVNVAVDLLDHYLIDPAEAAAGASRDRRKTCQST